MSKDYLSDLTGEKVLITGASAGIGKACAEYFGSIGAHLLLVARRENILERIVQEFQGEYLAGDINNSKFRNEMNDKGFFNAEIVINNAGLALGKDLFEDTKDEDMDLVMQTNINSAFKVVRECLKNMKANSKGDIVNICSIASHDAYARGAVYCASKHALLAMGKALRFETHGENIRVINISPGMVETEFSKVRFRGDEKAAEAAYAGMNALQPDDIAWQIGQAVRVPRHINLDEIIILATDQAGATTVKRN